MKGRMLSYKGVMEKLCISKSSAYEVMWAIPHIEHPALRVWESDLEAYIEKQMIYPIECKKRRVAQ